MNPKTYYSQITKLQEPLTARTWTGYCWLTPESTKAEIAASDKWGKYWESTTEAEKQSYCDSMNR